MSAAMRVSIVIPTRNAGPVLGRLLQALHAQDDDTIGREIVAIDSGSTDGTLGLLQSYGATILSIAPGAFNHGETRNAALARASGELAVLMVQDAVPASPGWLQALIRPLREDPRVAGSFARQQPWPDASSITSHYLSNWVAAGRVPRIVGPMSRAELRAMTPAARHAACAFDNVCACVRMDVWRRHPFRRVAIAEDLEWAAEVLAAGHALAFAPDAVVWHSHERSARYELHRTYLVHQRLQQLFGLATVPTIGALFRAVGASIPLHVRLAVTDRTGRRARSLIRGGALSVALPLGQYLGARSAREGRELMKVQDV